MNPTRTWIADAGLGVVLAVIGVVGSWGADRRTAADTPIGGLALTLVVLAALALVPRRRWPLPVLGAVTVCTSTYLVLGYTYGPILLSFLVAVYTVARHLRPARSVPAAVVALAVLLVHLFTNDTALPGLLGVVPGSAWVVVPFAVGLSVRLTREAADRQRGELVRQQVDEERLRVVQEVHDVVGHGLAAINMQANVALHVREKDPDQAVAALDAISRSSAEALAELRSTLQVIRGGDRDDARAPTPGLERLDDLCRRMRLAGMEVQVRTTGRADGPLEDPPDDPLPPAVDLAAYRVVQEALTNVLRHGGEKVATVEVAHETGAVSVTVSNPGSFSDGTHRSTGGLGLAGMRERVEALGGRFSAGAVRGGFEVRAWLPVRQAP